MWLSPGGHIDPNELLEDAVIREIQEELGVKSNMADIEGPFFFGITDIDNFPQVCRRHFDIWYLFKTDGENFLVDPREFFKTKWMNIHKVKERVTDQGNLFALKLVEKMG